MFDPHTTLITIHILKADLSMILSVQTFLFISNYRHICSLSLLNVLSEFPNGLFGSLPRKTSGKSVGKGCVQSNGFVPIVFSFEN